MDVSALRQKLTAYLPPDRLRDIEEAYTYSEKAHSGQIRASGKPYIMHPLTVADILADWHADTPSVIAALLHDVVEDTPITLEQIKERFGGDIAQLVDGLSKIQRLESIDRDVREAEDFRKLLLAAANDWRVIFIKLADRLHNMRTLSAIPDAGRRRLTAAQTSEIYAPIAGRLGIIRVQEELQNLAFRYLHPNRFRILTKAMKSSHTVSRQALEAVEKTLRDGLEKYGITCTLEKRRKNIYSVHQKMEKKRLSFAEVEDIIGFRLIVEDRLTCYQTLGVLHELFVPMPHRFRDFIAIPKSNGYQSLHTGLLSKTGLKIDVQIRTAAMHEVAEHGLAAHWLYKRSDGRLDKVQEEALHRLSSLVRLHAENPTPGEFMENIKIDLFPAEMYVLTPRGKIVTLPHGATALDMAFAIHTEVGSHAERAKINGQTLPISMPLNSGDQVEIITHPDIIPLPHWLRYAKTARARSHIRHVLSATAQKESAAIGKNLLINAVHKLEPDTDLDGIDDAPWRTLLGGNNMKNRDELYRALGLGKMLPDLAARTLLRRRVKRRTMDGKLRPISIVGAGRSAIQLSPCCYPLPDEPIIGILRKERGLIIHSGVCPAVRSVNRRSERWTDVQWNDDAGQRLHRSAIRLRCNNRPGLISIVSGVISDLNINIVTCNFDGGALEQESLTLEMIVEVHNLAELEALLSELEKMPEVVSAQRKLEV